MECLFRFPLVFDICLSLFCPQHRLTFLLPLTDLQLNLARCLFDPTLKHFPLKHGSSIPYSPYYRYFNQYILCDYMLYSVLPERRYFPSILKKTKNTTVQLFSMTILGLFIMSVVLPPLSPSIYSSPHSIPKDSNNSSGVTLALLPFSFITLIIPLT